MRIIITNGRIIDPANQMDEIGDIIISNGKILKTGKNAYDALGAAEDDKVIDAKGKWVVPGFIDLHVHLREPGYEHKETILTGSQSAAKGGFTSICCMPNTSPVIDNEIVVEYINMKAQREAVVNVLPIGSITKGQNGEELANIGKMAKVGICAISEDGRTVENPSLLKTAMKYAEMFDLPVFSHCEEPRLTGKGQINAGNNASFLGLAGIPNDSESIIVARDIILADSVDAKLHICHVSTRQSVDILMFAQSKGQMVTAEVTPHHFTLTDEDIKEYDANYKMAPPLRSVKDKQAIIDALKANVISVIATDHAPHHYDEKNCEFERAANGIVGLETAFPLAYTELVEKYGMSPSDLIAKLTCNPAKIINSPKGTLSIGAEADITIIGVEREYAIDVSRFASKGKNSPFDGRCVKGAVEYTIVGGKIVVAEGELQ